MTKDLDYWEKVGKGAEEVWREKVELQNLCANAKKTPENY